jgi:UDP-N-acetylmuramyl pentapeptide synthase
MHGAGPFVVIDESYNANPASMRAALALLGQASPTGRGRRIAVLGDMLELGDEAAAYHRSLAPAVAESAADIVFLAGPLMEGLWQALPEERRGAYAECAAKLEPILLETIGPGDVIMLKASLGTRLGPIVEAVKRHFAAEAE